MQIETPLGGFPRRSAPYQEPPAAPEPDAGDQPGGLTAAAQKEVIRGLEAGAFLETSLAAVGITVNTFYEWRERCAAGDEEARPLTGFYAACEKAEAKAELDLVRGIRAAPPNWEALVWLLQRRWPERWRHATDKIEFKGETEF